MGVEIGAFFERARVPRRELWQAAIDTLELPVQLPEEFDPTSVTGPVPFAFAGEDFGVDAAFVPATDRRDWRELTDQLGRSRRRQLGRRDAFLAFRWGGSYDEMACADVVLAALAVLIGAQVWDLEGDEILEPAQAVAQARSAVELALLERGWDQPTA